MSCEIISGVTDPVVFWFLVTVGAGLLEISTAGLFSVWFSIGALITMLPAWLGWSFIVQIIIFVFASALALILTKPFFEKWLRVAKTPTNADSLIGQKALVKTAIKNIEGRGRVSVNGLDWNARSTDGKDVEEGEIVKILKIEGVTLIVEKTQEEK